MSSIKYVSEIQSDGTLKIPSSLLIHMGKNKKVLVTLNPIKDEPKEKKEQALDSATKELLEMIRNAPDLGISDQSNLSKDFFADGKEH